MKKKMWFFGLIALIAVIGFSMVACDNSTDTTDDPYDWDDEEGTGGTGGAVNPSGSIGARIYLSGIPVTKDASATSVTTTDYQYSYASGSGGTLLTAALRETPLSPEVKLTNPSTSPTATIRLGTPADSVLTVTAAIDTVFAHQGTTIVFTVDNNVFTPVSPSTAKCFIPYEFSSDATGTERLRLVGSNNYRAFLMWVNEDITLDGTTSAPTAVDSSIQYAFNKIALYNGWNYIYETTGSNQNTKIILQSSTQPAGFTWQLYKP